MSRRSDRRRGFTLLEVAIGMAVSTVAMGSVVGLWTASDDLSSRSQVSLRAEAEHRANLATIGALLRDIAPTSLAAFDVNGRSTSPRFKRVTGVSGSTPTLGPEHTLLWQAVSAWGRDDRAAVLGQVVLRVGGVDRVLARRVPEGGFLVERSGRTLSVSLVTYWQPEEAGPLQRLEDRLDVSMRN
jgi:prepilin-type N-terminal cleavage/methylation domain-containing protein